MDSDSYLRALKFALIESIMAESDADLLDLISKLLMVEGAGTCQHVQPAMAG